MSTKYELTTETRVAVDGLNADIPINVLPQRGGVMTASGSEHVGSADIAHRAQRAEVFDRRSSALRPRGYVVDLEFNPGVCRGRFSAGDASVAVSLDHLKPGAPADVSGPRAFRSIPHRNDFDTARRGRHERPDCIVPSAEAVGVGSGAVPRWGEGHVSIPRLTAQVFPYPVDVPQQIVLRNTYAASGLSEASGIKRRRPAPEPTCDGGGAVSAMNVVQVHRRSLAECIGYGAKVGGESIVRNIPAVFLEFVLGHILSLLQRWCLMQKRPAAGAITLGEAMAESWAAEQVVKR